jgi:hypothetical protein
LNVRGISDAEPASEARRTLWRALLRGPTKQAGVSNVVAATPIGGGAMTTVANLLARKQRLVERLHENPGPNERAEIERLLAQVDAALDMLEEVGPPRRATSHRRL